MTDLKQNLVDELKEVLDKHFSGNKIVPRFLNRLKEKNLTKDENLQSHFCIYFAAYDTKAKLVFIGHHKKSGLWLFNGGHIDKNETTNQALVREIKEEWGLDSKNFKIKHPTLLTITEIYNPEKQSCRSHYDLWHFIPVNKSNFRPEESKVKEEFYEIGWKNLKEARNSITDKNTLLAIDFIENNYFNL